MHDEEHYLIVVQKVSHAIDAIWLFSYQLKAYLLAISFSIEYCHIKYLVDSWVIFKGSQSLEFCMFYLLPKFS